MSAWQTPEVEQLFEAVLSLESMEECRLFFEDVCTIKELLDISQRLKMAKMLYDGAHYSEVSKGHKRFDHHHKQGKQMP